MLSVSMQSPDSCVGPPVHAPPAGFLLVPHLPPPPACVPAFFKMVGAFDGIPPPSGLWVWHKATKALCQPPPSPGVRVGQEWVGGFEAKGSIPHAKGAEIFSFIFSLVLVSR